MPPTTPHDVYRRKGERRGKDVAEIFDLLDNNQSALVLMMLSDSFYRPDRATAIVPLVATEKPDSNRRHAVVAVGHGTFNGERLVLIRNSWGAAWGFNGHAWIPEAFLIPRLMRVALLTENIDVSTGQAAA
jgi:hypothetical protein